MECLDFFCANPDCPLHIRAGDPGVAGWGHWAQLPNGLIVSHSLADGQLWCDLCLRAHAGQAHHADVA